ncbi:hypothetical protein XHV734_5061 [Xanthomonas hortorum pv. vitians]|nr:hypothetical protein XHV734_5061 [Xanthomonas hortorum pv. vitians]
MVGACMFDMGVTVHGAAAVLLPPLLTACAARCSIRMRQAKMRRAATPAAGALRTRRE